AIDLLESRILATLAYAGLFHDGLTESEVSHRLFGPGPEAPEAVAAALGRLAGPAGPVRRAGATYYLAGGSPPVPRLSMALRAERVWAAAVAMLPFVRFIGLTGARAKGAPDADMDLFVVAAP